MKIRNWLVAVLFVSAIVGFADSAYLTAEHVRGTIPPCGVAKNCELVLASAYSAIGPVPVAALGLAFYGLTLVLLVAYFDTHNRRLLHGIAWIVSAGLLASFYFVFVQVFILHSLCPYCLLSTLMTVLMFGASARIMHID